MSKYSCKCPVPGCDCSFEIEAEDWEAAFKKIYPGGNRHIIECHPDFPEPVDRMREARKYAKNNLRLV